MRKLGFALCAPVLTLAVPASAHFNLTMPPSIAKSTEGGKGAAPCGPDDPSSATGTVTAVTGGQALALHIDETVGHPGFYRFALAITSPAVFPADNVVKDKTGAVLTPTSTADSYSADYESPAVFPVLADHVFAHTMTPVQSFPSVNVPGQVLVPNINCDKCTLQVIEFMANHPSNGPLAGYFYHHCAFLKITADPNKPLDNSGGGGGTGTGSAGGGGGGGASGSGGAGGMGGPAAAGAGAGSAGGPDAGGTGGVAEASAAGSAGAAMAGVAGRGGTEAAGSFGAAGASTSDPSGVGGALLRVKVLLATAAAATPPARARDRGWRSRRCSGY